MELFAWSSPILFFLSLIALLRGKLLFIKSRKFALFILIIAAYVIPLIVVTYMPESRQEIKIFEINYKFFEASMRVQFKVALLLLLYGFLKLNFKDVLLFNFFKRL
ncbi:hypothetical protein [Halanaerobium praevalens]|uniref:Uncharacterized protein n=1 Tax=Halanaerobium praevalens (strain ATCC 33744 / DSM 2228 / GSL) TaxID=572479 RepID=E3DNG5_HALPG|nr:hypothetical protein [Halanaerobium praevalens]ADO76503.1 hypothetical protein Hprae_0347 [Halanaerobium praevalens DSM 2228]